MDNPYYLMRRRSLYRSGGAYSGYQGLRSIQMVISPSHGHGGLVAKIPRAPSYFSTYFEEQLRLDESGNGPTKTLFIDRDPDTFADICRHLQGTVAQRVLSDHLTYVTAGYYAIPRDNAHYVRLYADAQFYSLPRLISQLSDSGIFVSIGGQQFQIPRDTFSGPGNSSNFFSLGFAGFLGSRDDAFPGLESKGLMRPPAVQPQIVPNRSPKVFEDLIHLSRGYPLTIRDKEHRAQLLSDCKYYGFKGLMHKIFVHSISYNAERGKSEIIMQVRSFRSKFSCLVANLGPIPRFHAHFGGFAPLKVANLGQILLFYALFGGSAPYLVAHLGHNHFSTHR